MWYTPDNWSFGSGIIHYDPGYMGWYWLQCNHALVCKQKDVVEYYNETQHVACKFLWPAYFCGYVYYFIDLLLSIIIYHIINYYYIINQSSVTEVMCITCLSTYSLSYPKSVSVLSSLSITCGCLYLTKRPKHSEMICTIYYMTR